MVKHIRTKEELNRFWSNPTNRKYTFYFFREDNNYPKYSNTKYLIGKQTYGMRMDGGLWDIIDNVNNKEVAKKIVIKLANRNRFGVIFETREW